MTNNTATIIENIVLFDVSADAQAINMNRRNATVKGKNFHFVESFHFACLFHSQRFLQV